MDSTSSPPADGRYLAAHCRRVSEFVGDCWATQIATKSGIPQALARR